MVSDVLLVLGSFLASSVEMVEAITIVLAVGITRGWRSALLGVAAGSVALGVVCVALGPTLVTVVPIDYLRVVVGTLLLIFGMQWLRKAIERATGLRAIHDEEKIFERNVTELESEGPVSTATMDWTGFVVSFKGVFLEGLEVAFIVLSFGVNHGSAANGFGLAATGAILAFFIVGGIGVAVHRPLSNVPENTIKFAVGLMLMSFGTFWSGEGIGVDWKLADGSILGLLVFYGAMAYLMVRMLKARQAASQPAVAAAGGAE